MHGLEAALLPMPMDWILRGYFFSFDVKNIIYKVINILVVIVKVTSNNYL